MPAIAPNKHIARSRYRDAILADNPLFYFRMKFGRDQTFPVGIVDETNQWTATFEESLSGSGTSLIPASSGLIKADASPSLGWTGNFWAGASIPHDTALHPKGSFSVEAWIGDWTDSKQKMIMSKDIQGSIWAEFTLFMTTSGQIRTQLLQQAGLTNISDITSPLSYNDGLTHHVVMVFDTDANLHMLYIDGELVVSNPWTFTLYTNTVDIAFGFQPDIGVPSDANDASLDEVAMYHYALTPGQIAHHYDVGTAVYRNYREVVRGTGPISYWRLGGGSIADDVMKVNDLTIVGPIVQGFTSPMYLEDHNKDSCMAFDGVNTVVTTAGSPRASTLGINGKHVAPGGCAIEFWMYPRSFSTFTAIISTERTTAAGWLVYLRPDPTFPHLTMLSRATGPAPDGWQTQGVVKIKQWSHVVINYEFNTACTIFIDGVDVGSSQIFTPISAAGDDTGNPIDIGDALGDDTGIVPFDGYLSDVAFYDRALTEKEVTLHYRESQLSIATEDFFGYEPGTFFPANFNPSWTFETTDSTFTIIDDGGYAPMPSKHIQATVDVAFTGSYITFKDIPPFADGTVQAEIAVANTGISNEQPAILMRYIDANNHLAVRLSSAFGRGIFITQTVAGVETFSSTGVFNWVDDTKYYIEAVMTGNQIIATLYSDIDRSTVLATTSRTVDLVGPGKAGVASIGNINVVSHFDNFRVDVVEPVVSLYEAAVLEDTPVFYFRQESNVLGNDSSGNGNNADVISSVTAGIGKVGGGGLYAGTTSSYQRVPSDATIDDLTSTVGDIITFEAWVNRDSSIGAVDTQLATKIDDAGSSVGWNFWLDDTGHINTRAFRASTDDLYESTPTIPFNELVHIVGVLKVGGTLGEQKFYINGSLVGTTSVVVGSGTINSDAGVDLYVGLRGRPSVAFDQPFKGVLDELAIYNYELPAARVLAHYNAGL